MPPTPNRQRYRRITASDNSLTTGRVTNPVGSFYQPPQSNPSTAAAGSLGAGSAMLPANNANAALNYYYNPASQIQNLPAPVVNRTAYNQTGAPNTARQSYVPPPAYAPAAGAPNTSTANSFAGWNAQNAAVQNAAQNQTLSAASGLSIYQQSERGTLPPSPSSFRDSARTPQAAGLGAMVNRATNAFSAASEMFELTGTFDPSTLPPAVGLDTQRALGLSPQELQGMGYTFNGNAWVNPAAPGGGGQPLTAAQGGNTDFAQTGFAQSNAANNVAFTNQLRWDPERRRYVRIGQLINEGRLDVRDRQARLRRSRPGRQEGGGGGGGQSAPAATTGGGGSVNVGFNTAEG